MLPTSNLILFLACSNFYYTLEKKEKRGHVTLPDICKGWLHLTGVDKSELCLSPQSCPPSPVRAAVVHMCVYI